jgi:hypothetical protein
MVLQINCYGVTSHGYELIQSDLWCYRGTSDGTSDSVRRWLWCWYYLGIIEVTVMALPKSNYYEIDLQIKRL